MSLATGDLTTLATAKAYMSAPPADAVLAGLITRVSRQVQTYLSRTLLVPATYTQQFSGTGTRQLVLPDWPLLSLTSLAIGGVAVSVAPQADSTTVPNVPYGYRFQPWNGQPPGAPAILDLVGGISFYQGGQNIVVSYRAGYQVTNEAQTIPSASGPYTITPIAPYGAWATDEGVVSAAGVAFTAVSASPTAGQYVPPSASSASYTFNAADAGTAVLISYGFIPADIEQATLDLIAERAAYRTRVGVRSQSLAAQETITYDLSAIPAYIMSMLRPYVSVIPPAMGSAL